MDNEVNILLNKMAPEQLKTVSHGTHSQTGIGTAGICARLCLSLQWKNIF
jgi:hypothetical protein